MRENHLILFGLVKMDSGELTTQNKHQNHNWHSRGDAQKKNKKIEALKDVVTNVT